ncbi:SMAD/FHA domain-containing protein [Striga hermonthica]|uniref:SMAD/FHA domain-containing protein n=1 Tax=Striga hermonthica TaxID=68872 RepID=A0A9N7N1L7_STRHE|nr:SMAD/FHA domain-containing protein [Striga hermonthica]
MAKEDEISTPSPASMPVASPNPAQKSPSLPQSKPPEEVHNVGNNNSPASRNVKSSVDFVRAQHCKIYRRRVSTGDTEQESDNCFSVFLKDSSTNGTYLNWDKLTKTSSEAKLRHGDIISIAFVPQHEHAFAFVFREVQKSSRVTDCSSLKRKPEEYGADTKRLKGIGLGASDGPISLDDFRSLQRSNTELRKHLENEVATVESLRAENRAAIEKHENELKELRESVAKSYQDQLSQLNHQLETKDKELAELNKISAELRHGIEDLNERLGASIQSCLEANEIINSQKASLSELKGLLEEERDQRREEREKASLDMKVALQKVQAEAAEEIKRVSDGALRREKEQQEMINKLQEADKERCSLVETLRSKLEDTRQKLVNSDNKVRQLEGQMREEQQAFTTTQKRVEELEHEIKRLRKELEREKAAREEAWAKVSALELEISAAVRDLDFERRRLKAARERIMLRETQLRAFYSTTEEISVLFAKQQEQLKSMQRTLEDEENYETTSTDFDLTRAADGNRNRSSAGDEEEARQSNTTAKGRDELSSDEASVTEKHECNNVRSQGENGPNTQEVEFVGHLWEDGKGAFGSDINGVGTQPELSHGDLIGTEQIPGETERVLETESQNVRHLNSNSKKNIDEDNEENGNKNCSQSNSPVEARDTMEETEDGGTIKTNDLLASEVAGSWACSTAPSVHGENEYTHSPTHDSSSLVAESQHIPLTKSGGDADRMSHERRALSEMIGIVAPDLKKQFSLAVGPDEGVASDSESKGCNDDDGDDDDDDDDDVDNEGRDSGSDDDETNGGRVRSEDRMEEDEDDDTQEDSMG